MKDHTPEGTFTDLEIRIFQRQDKRYPVEITLGGQQEFPRGFLAADVLPWISKADPVADGQRLFEALLADPTLRSAWAEARGQAPQRRIRLRIDVNAAELHALPWELLREDTATLSADASTPFSRYLPVSEPWGGVVEERPVRVLAVISNPDDLEDWYNLSSLDVELERSILEKVFLVLDAAQIQLDFLTAPVTLERLETALREGYHILHYVGHGVFNQREQHAALYMQDEDGDTQVVLDDEVIAMLSRQQVRPRLVFLAACQSATRSTADAFLGLGPRLVAAGVPAVVAMQDFVTIKTAQKLSLVFYRRLVEHGVVDRAMNEARSTLLTADRPDAAVPVLFMRLKSGQLWGHEAEGEEALRETAGPEIPPPPEPTPPPEAVGFVGRDAELTRFTETLARSGLAVVAGMPGVGKTALASVLVRRVGTLERTFWHTFHEDEGIEEVIWKLAGFLFWHGHEDLWRMLQRTRLAGGQPPPTRDLLDYLAQAIQGQGYLLCLDELQFLSEDDADLLNSFIQRLVGQESSFLIVSQCVPAFVRIAECEPLPGLSVEDTHSLLIERGLSLPEALEAELHARTGGNAQFLTLAIDALHRADAPAQMISQLSETDDIERFLMTEVDRGLTDEERDVMSGVAVLLGYPGTRDVIEVVLDVGRVRRVLSDLSRRNLLTVSEGSAGKAYTQNAMVRDFYYSLLSRRERRTMHHRAGDYYEAEEQDVLQAARHYERAGETKKAARLAAADVWALINQGHARPLCRLLARFTAQQVEPEQWVRVNLALGQVQALLGEGDVAQETYHDALAGVTTLPDTPETQDLKASTCRWLSELHYQRGEYAPALEWVQEGLAALDGRETADIAELTLIATNVHYRQGDYDSARSQAENSLCLGQTFDRATALARAHNVLGLIHRRRGDNATAIKHYRQSLEPCQHIGDLTGVAKSHNLIGTACLRMGDWPTAKHHYSRAYEIFDQLGNAYWCAGLCNNLGLINLKQGRLDEASSFFQSGLELSERTNKSIYLKALFHENLGTVFVRRNEPDEAKHHLQTSLAYCQQIQVREFLPDLYRLQAEAALLTHDLAEAEAHGQQSLTLARELGARDQEGWALRVLGEIATAQGQVQRAEEYLGRGVSVLEEVGNEYDWARTQLSLARLYMSKGKPEKSSNALDQCMPVFERLEAQLDLTAARALREQLVSKVEHT